MTTLWGRERERETLRGLVAATARGRGGVAVLVGEPGIGKTRLLADTAEHAPAVGCVTLSAAADELFARRPFALLVDALDLRARTSRHLARVDAGLRQLGSHRDKRRRRARPTTGWDSLTPTERAVAALVADGLVYREVGERLFISRRTVETHVANMFAKLDLSSRAELARLARHHRRTETPT